MASTFGSSFNAELAAYSLNANNSSGAIMNIASQTLLGRNSSGVGPVEAMNATTTKYVLGLDNVENTALSTWTGSSSITTLGTVSSGTWNATAIPVSKGGTGNTTFTQDSVIMYDNSTSRLASKTPTQVKTAIGLNNVENTALSTWTGNTSINTVGTITTGTWNATPIPVTSGGTGNSTFAANGVTFYDGNKITNDGVTFRWDNSNSRLGLGVPSGATLVAPLQLGNSIMMTVGLSGPAVGSTDTHYYLITSCTYGNSEAYITGCDFRISGLLTGHLLERGKATIDITFSIRGGLYEGDKPRITGIVNGSFNGNGDVLIYKRYDASNEDNNRYYIYISCREYAGSNLTLQRTGFTSDRNCPFLVNPAVYSTTAPSYTLWYKLSTGLEAAAVSLMQDGVIRNDISGNLTIPGTLKSAYLTRSYASKTNVNYVSNVYTILETDPDFLGFTPITTPTNAHLQINLPAPSASGNKGKEFTIMDEIGTCSGGSRLDINGSINNQSNAIVVLNSAYAFARFISNGTTWIRV